MKNIYVYQTSPNQKIVHTQKAASNAEHLYGICNIEAMLSAARKLSDRAFKLYTRMNLHQNEHTYALSPAEIDKSIGMSDKRYRDAVNELIEKGYLVQDKKRKNVYVFFESPEISGSITTSKQPVDVADLDWSYDDNDRVAHTISPGNPAISGGEILHYNTSYTTDNTKNNTVNTIPVTFSKYDFKISDDDDPVLPF